MALANARLHRRERVQAEERRVANLALLRSMQIHDRLTKVAFGGERQQGIAQAVYELTGRRAAIEDLFWKLGVTSRVQLARMAAEQGSLIGDGNIPSLGSSRLICASWRGRRT